MRRSEGRLSLSVHEAACVSGIFTWAIATAYQHEMPVSEIDVDLVLTLVENTIALIEETDVVPDGDELAAHFDHTISDLKRVLTANGQASHSGLRIVTDG